MKSYASRQRDIERQAWANYWASKADVPHRNCRECGLYMTHENWCSRKPK